jgi:hypothetical protein
MDRFDQLLKELGDLINLPLHLDTHRVCKLNVSNLLHIHIEPDASRERILIATFITDIPAGKYRENILKEALKSNGLYPRIGTLGFCERNNQLSLFEYVSQISLTTQHFADILAEFIEKGVAWKRAIESGGTPPSVEPSRRSDRGIFGLK